MLHRNQYLDLRTRRRTALSIRKKDAIMKTIDLALDTPYHCSGTDSRQELPLQRLTLESFTTKFERFNRDLITISTKRWPLPLAGKSV